MDLSSPSTSSAARATATSGFYPWLKVWAGLVAFLLLTKAVITFVFPVTFEKGSGQENVFSWQFMALISILLLAAMWLQQRTGFPAPLDRRITNRSRFTAPVVVGLVFGTVSIVLDLIFGGTRVVAANTGNATFNIAFPGSLFAYTGGAILVETIYRLLPLPLLLWLVSSVILRGRYQTQVFWVLAIVLAAWEPYSQAQVALGPGAGISAMGAAEVVQIYAENLAANAFFRRYGLLAPLALRVADYLVWHITYGNFICNC